MQDQVVQPQGPLSYLIPLVILAVLFAFRARRMSQVRPLKLEQLWIVPAVYLLLVVFTFVMTPPTPMGWLVAAVALMAGAGLGWQRGRLMAITVDPVTHTLSQKGSPLAMLLLLGIVVVKLIAQREGGAMGLDAALVTDAALAFGLGMFTLTRVEMFVRARRLRTAVRSAGVRS